MLTQASKYKTRSQGLQLQQQQQQQEEVCGEGPGQCSSAQAAAACGAAEKQRAHPAAAEAGKAQVDQQQRPSGKQQQQGQQQQQLCPVSAATVQRAQLQRKAAAGVGRATQAVLGNSQHLAAAAADKKAVAVAQRAALPAGVSAPATAAQRDMVQQLDTGALGIDIAGIVAALSGVPARLDAGEGSADVEADIAYAEKLAGTLAKPSTRVQAAITRAKTAVNTTKAMRMLS